MSLCLAISQDDERQLAVVRCGAPCHYTRNIGSEHLQNISLGALTLPPPLSNKGGIIATPNRRKPSREQQRKYYPFPCPNINRDIRDSREPFRKARKLRFDRAWARGEKYTSGVTWRGD
ncbi:hypothetical protein NPIL_632641 [Nephila pilipes]|uniref:Uncharacterized protein n=1 Tax=Nephila pilipes TaxID=299642 RepID=A0A8X6QTB8_NEPPI|nr:hypothetical protein NPIL_632641 [Nephila pilipes]